MRFSASTGCFYPDDLAYPDLPSDLVEVPKRDFDAAMARPPGDAIEVAGGRIVVVPRPAPSLAELRAEMWQRVKTERDRRCAESGFRVSDKWFHSDTQSRIQQLGLVLLGTSIPPGTQWKTMDGSFVAMTPALAQQILAAAASSDQAIFSAAETHRAAIEASPDPEKYDLTSGWPLAFVG